MIRFLTHQISKCLVVQSREALPHEIEFIASILCFYPKRTDLISSFFMAHHKIPRIEIPILITLWGSSSVLLNPLHCCLYSSPISSRPSMFVRLAVDPLSSSFLFVSFPKLSVVKCSFVANFISVLDPFFQDRVANLVEEDLIIIYVSLSKIPVQHKDR